MPGEAPQSLFEQYVNKLKNNKFLAIILILVTIIVGAASFKGALVDLVGKEEKEGMLVSPLPSTAQADIDSKVRTAIKNQFDLGPEKSFTRSTKLNSLLPADDQYAAGMSLAMVEFTMELDEQFGLYIPDEDVKKWRTVGDVIDYVLQADGKFPSQSC